MKKVVFILTDLLLTAQNALAIEELKDVGIAKYAVLETLRDDVPIRNKDSENASRITELYKKSVLFADKQNKDYYRVELDDDKYACVNKKYVKV